MIKGEICWPKAPMGYKKARRILKYAVLRLSKNLYNEKGCPPYPYKSAKSRNLCVAFCTSQGASVRQRRAYSPLQKLEKVA